MSKEKVCGIYKITNSKNYKIYIGSSNDIMRRWQEHLRDLKNRQHCNGHLQSAWDKYGENNFLFEIIEVVENESNLLNRENFWIHQTRCYDRNVGYNISMDAIKILLPDGKRKEISKQLKEKYKGEGNPFSKLSEDIVKNIVTDLQNPNLSWKEIMARNNVNKTTISAIITRHNWGYLTKDIEFPKRNTVCKLTKDDVIKISELLLQGYNDEDIGKMYLMSSMTISNIRLKKSWKDVTKDFDFSNVNNRKQKGGVSLKMSYEKYVLIREAISKKIKNKDISKLYNVDISVVSSIKNNHSYKDYNDVYMNQLN